jgi:putative FmdB family regulatory protein
MPTYDYECPHCGHAFELFQKMTDEPLKKCPKCKKEVKRLIGTGSGIIFKGSGFYATDYRKGSKGSSGPSCSESKNKGCDGCPHHK